MYGGKLKNGSLSSELWFYNIYTKKWSLRAQNSILQPPALTRHTLTLAEHTKSVYLVGGSNSKGYFSSKIFCIQINLGKYFFIIVCFKYITINVLTAIIDNIIIILK